MPTSAAFLAALALESLEASELQKQNVSMGFVEGEGWAYSWRQPPCPWWSLLRPLLLPSLRNEVQLDYIPSKGSAQAEGECTEGSGAFFVDRGDGGPLRRPRRCPILPAHPTKPIPPPKHTSIHPPIPPSTLLQPHPPIQPHYTTSTHPPEPSFVHRISIGTAGDSP